MFLFRLFDIQPNLTSDYLNILYISSLNTNYIPYNIRRYPPSSPQTTFWAYLIDHLIHLSLLLLLKRMVCSKAENQLFIFYLLL